jgi:hypothetical protein
MNSRIRHEDAGIRNGSRANYLPAAGTASAAYSAAREETR